MSFASLLRTILFNLGALAVAYVLLLSGIHKFTYKVWLNSLVTRGLVGTVF